MCTFFTRNTTEFCNNQSFFQSAIYIVLQLSAYIICNTIDLRTHFLSIMYAKRHSEMMEGSCSKNFDFCPPLKNIYYGPKTFWKLHLFIPRCHLACLLCPIQGGEYQKRFRQSVSAQVVVCLAVVTLIKDCQQNLEITY